MRATRSIAAGVLAAMMCSLLNSQVPDKSGASRERSLQKISAINTRYAVLNINNLTSWMRNDGHSNHSPYGDDGTYYPRNTGSVIYQDCLVWGGKAYKDAAHTQPAPRQLVRVGGGTYSVGTRAGRIIDPNQAPIAGVGVTDPNLPEARAYRIRRDYYTIDDWELQQDAGSVFETFSSSASATMMDEVKAQYAVDWMEWPVVNGAPFIDRNGNGIYDPPPAFNLDPNAGPIFTVDSLIPGGYDEPGVAGADLSLPADQVIFTVYHDLNVGQSLSFVGSEPMGLEVQKTMWGYRKSNALGSIYFVCYRLINKGGVDTDTASGDQFGAFWIDSMYVAQWSDPDVGNGIDDFIGCDSILGLGFCYNGGTIDAEFRAYNLPPPAVGYDFFAGAIVPSAGDSAIVGFRRRAGYRNLPLTSFGYFMAGSPYTDPPGGTGAYLVGTGRWWKMLRGFAPLGDLTTADQPYYHPPGIPLSQFPLSGDPVSQQGWSDGYGETISSDRRMYLSSGPFSFAPGDTQEVYVALVAGLGADRLTSIQILKNNDRYAQSAFNRAFAVPRPPAQPRVNATALDRKIVLEWGSDASAVRQTETMPSGSLLFEGYNVYELPSATSRLSEAVHRTTFDVVNSVTRIVDPEWNPYTDAVGDRVIQYGTNSGIRRNITITRSHVLDSLAGKPLTNGNEYHFAVTAYNYTPVVDDLPKSQESAPVIISIKPRIPFGESAVTSVGETLAVAHVSGSSTARVAPLVIDPLAGNGDTYRVTLQVVDSTPAWQLMNETKGVLVASGETNLSGDEVYPIVDGTLVKVIDTSQPGSASTDVFEFIIPAPRRSQADIDAGFDRIGVYPNPYLADRDQIFSAVDQAVTFTNLPQRATFRIFNLAGHLVRTLHKDTPSQFFNWDLTNERGWRVASGMYICYVELPDLGRSKVLKLGVVIGERIPGGY